MIQMVAAVEQLYNLLHSLVLEELQSLELGHSYDRTRLGKIRNLVTIIMYLKYATLSNLDMMKIIQSYEKP